MPIDIDRFEEAPEETLQAGGQTNAERILSYLATRPEKAFTPKELHEATEIPRGSVGVVLSRLEERDLVRHRGEYWAIDAEADVDHTLATTGVARAATDRFGPEDPEEWGPGSASADRQDDAEER